MRRARLLCGLFFLALACAGSARAQEKMVPPSFDGIEVFCQILKVAGLKPYFQLIPRMPPEDTLLVVLGELPNLADYPLVARDVERFLDAGGAALFASDRADNGGLAFLKLRITGLAVQQQNRSAYHEEEKCPLLHYNLGHALTNPLLFGSKGLATNGPSDIHIEPKSPLVQLSVFPDDCRHAKNGSHPGVFMAASPTQARPSGRVVVMAGQGVFFNSMLLQGDNDNFPFAWRCIHWLKEGPTKPRSHVLLINHGVVVPSFELPASFKAPMPGMPPLPVTAIINRLLRRMEEERMLQNVLEENVGLEAILQAMLLTASAALVLYGSWRLAKGIFRVDTTVPLLVEPMPPAGPAAAAVQLRELALAELDNYAEPAQALVRQWFWQQAGVMPTAWDEPGFRLPSWKVRGSWWQRWRSSRQVRYLGKLAHGSGQRLSGRRFRQVDTLLRQLGGDVTF